MIDPTLVVGALELEHTDGGLLPHRLPAWARAQTDDPQLALVEAQPAGVRLALRTDATHLELDVLPTKRRYVGAPARPDGWYDVLVDGVLVQRLQAPGGHVLDVDMMTGASTFTAGEPTMLVIDLPAGTKDVEVWLPHDEQTELIDLRADAVLAPADDDRPRWVHHGSSISHGSVATHPTEPWPVVAARLAGLDLVNLGFGGSALLDPFVARTIRDTPADLISLKLGINVVNQDLVRRRALGPAVHGYLDTIRDGHPDTPIRLVSPIHCGIHEAVPGSTAPDMAALAEGRVAFVAAGDPAGVARGALTLEVVREVLAGVVERRGDPHLSYVDGLALYGADDAVRLPLPDHLHPDSVTHQLIGERFAALGAW
ncbi:GDSL-like Lipase/Acylhydrolase family protein [Nocardioides alpinus]|uniref:Lipase n=1 Tax=Nocardioides alpinus TaxID=748909 RepID=A0A1I1B313_9ACTN|nr:SGNH/GDSL hydrolase family protein [Nocardioides alpinus]PKH40176.1 lipase [Nocardioides alpinus]SFB44759.1 GDSL-like Lipase/Acylhydrolase family protein [Nocardioides alpinus]